MAKAVPVSHFKDPIENAEEMIPLIVPVSFWDILVLQSEIENCAPGEILDRALSEYLDRNGGRRAKELATLIKKRQSIAQKGNGR